jgi:CHASE2 domain-containing sensor protein/tRNA A-37 threonylcarbamoyl transferase component Bud32
MTGTQPAARAQLPVDGRKLAACAVIFGAAAALALLAQLSGLVSSLDEGLVAARFSLRPAARAPSNVVLLTTNRAYTYSRGLPGLTPARSEVARAINLLDGARPRLVVLDFVLTAPSARDPGGDAALEQAIRRAGNVASAFYDVNINGEFFLFGQPGPALARQLRLITGSVATSEPIRRVPYSVRYPTSPPRRWSSLPVVAAERLVGHAIKQTDFPSGPAWISYYGPPGTLTHRAFGDLLGGRIAPSYFTGKLVLIGVDDPSIDRHLTSASRSTRMSGVEVVANQIMTVARGFPLRSTTTSDDVLVILLMAALAPITVLFLRARWVIATAGLAAGVYLVIVQLEFDSGNVLPVVAPLAALAVALGLTASWHYLDVSRERQQLRRLFAQMDPAVVAGVIDSSSATRAKLEPTAIVAGYRIDGRIAEGGMGAIYRATQLGLERKVALKVIRPDKAEDPSFRERFVRESRMAASIEHPNVLPIYEAGEDRGVLFIAMRFVEGVDLETRLALHGPPPQDEAITVFRQLASAVDSAHAVGLIHRDLKPANVLLTVEQPPHVYLTDFGVAAKFRQEASAAAGAEEIVGTVDYMAPEQILGQTVTPLADIYSLGAILYALVTAQTPYPAESAAQALWAHINEPPPQPSRTVAGLPRELDDIVARAMAKDPNKRYPSATALASAAALALNTVRPRTRTQTATVPTPIATTEAVETPISDPSDSP